ncbi:hypothetical protein SK128_014134 [Halocaridina rubra]|uniref:Uncharacterized protein n=1 Tax=Halocaridina rubra TaxID=373956 RepID=A0AAN8XLB5_HALRR
METKMILLILLSLLSMDRFSLAKPCDSDQTPAISKEFIDSMSQFCEEEYGVHCDVSGNCCGGVPCLYTPPIEEYSCPRGYNCVMINAPCFCHLCYKVFQESPCTCGLDWNCQHLQEP